jgi:hypothetical protein
MVENPLVRPEFGSFPLNNQLFAAAYSMYSQVPSIAGGYPSIRNPGTCHTVVIYLYDMQVSTCLIHMKIVILLVKLVFIHCVEGFKMEQRAVSD